MNSKTLEKEFNNLLEQYAKLKDGKDSPTKWKQRMLAYLKLQNIIELQNVLAFIEEIKPDRKQRELMELLIKSNKLKNYGE
jgi:hypothetical protein|tara:strand:- start:5034 stop:5276 length:243 start_codon:yes stop_codon:yes gene_type:complete